MADYIVLNSDGVELRRGKCPDNMVSIQAREENGETAIRYSPTDEDPDTFRLDDDRVLIPYDPPYISWVDPDDWEEKKGRLNAEIAAGYPSQYGPVDLRGGAKSAMMAAITLGQGIDLILLDNRTVTLGADEVRQLFADAVAWEQVKVMELQAQRPSQIESEDA